MLLPDIHLTNCFVDSTQSLTDCAVSFWISLTGGCKIISGVERIVSICMIGLLPEITKKELFQILFAIKIVKKLILVNLSYFEDHEFNFKDD